MKRLLSLDIMRGITVAGMILVNNGGGPKSFSPLQHCAWNGMTPCDLVFPFFLFIMGVSTYISLNKSEFKPSGTLIKKIVKRTLLIACVGWAINWFDGICEGDFLPFDHLRIPGVLQRIALCYGIVSIIAITVSHRWLTWLAGGLIVVYAIILSLGNGYLQDETNVIAIVDRSFFGEAHLYHKSPIDPEGLLSSISAVAHTLIGFLCGKIVMTEPDKRDKALRLLAAGFAMTALGLLFTYAYPLNKRIWSPTFVLVSCGLASMLLGWLMHLIDVRGNRQRWQTFFHVFGVNPLFLYVLSEVLAIVLGSFEVKPYIYKGIEAVIVNPYISSLAYAIVFVAVMFAAGYPLFKRKIYIKL